MSRTSSCFCSVRHREPSTCAASQMSRTTSNIALSRKLRTQSFRSHLAGSSQGDPKILPIPFLLFVHPAAFVLCKHHFNMLLWCQVRLQLCLFNFLFLSLGLGYYRLSLRTRCREGPLQIGSGRCGLCRCQQARAKRRGCSTRKEKRLEAWSKEGVCIEIG